MKNCYLLLLAVLSLTNTSYAFGPADSVFQVKQLPKDGLVISGGWTFHPTDNFNLTKYDFDAEGISINPSSHLSNLPLVENSGIGWFRVKLRIDSSLRNKTVGMMLSLFGAAEIYLNEKRMYQFGRVSKDYEQEKTQTIYARPFSIKLGEGENQIFAVRYSHHPKNMYVKTGFTPLCLQIILQDLNEAGDTFSLLVRRAYQFIGIALTIELAAALLTLFFFFSFRYRKEYLYFGLYFAFNFLTILIQSDLAGVGKSEHITVNEMGWIQIMIYLFATTGTFFHLNAIYRLLQVKQTRFYKFLFGYAVASLVSLPFLPAWAGKLPDAFFFLACLEILPLYYKAARRKFRGAWTLFTSILICFLFLMILILGNFQQDAGLVLVIIVVTMFTPALGIVIFLAGDFARTSSALKSRIVEVESLSKKTLAQEYDKQQILAAQKEKLEVEVQNRTAELSTSLEELKAAQSQLIQAEKMASLGMLTAGIAHEIQNPLNFVNNFSDINKELLDEMEAEMQKGSYNEALLVSATIKDNQAKIAQHGKRADGIVKSMLQHSRKSSGVKETTDINVLVDEHLRLSNHGMRAKNPGFSAAYNSGFDGSIEKIELVPQEIGRVLLNLFNNAFYAVHEKKKTNEGFEPLVSAITKNYGNRVEIIVKDNGGGIPVTVVDKIFQPFFTTKPSGEGTGLGLSLSYDIIRAHGGEIKVNSTEGEGTEFVIQLPQVPGHKRQNT